MSECTETVIRYGLILVFEYKRVPLCIDVPTTLLSMDTDLTLAYNLCKDRFNIPPANMTVVTDLSVRQGVMNPWDPLTEVPANNPRIVRLPTPDISRVCREIAQFVENTVRGIRDIKAKGGNCRHEVFIYISGHGAQIPNHGNWDTAHEYDNALIFTSENGKMRKYLRDDDIFRVLFGKVDIDDHGMMTIPITTRQVKVNPSTGSLFYSFEDEMISFALTSGVKDRKRCIGEYQLFDETMVDERSPRGTPTYIRDRGLPSDTGMLVMIDACHSGTMTDFHYKYDPKEAIMRLTREPPKTRYTFPTCICISASQDDQLAPSTSSGSTFTRYMCHLFNHLKGTLSIKAIHDLIYSQLPTLLVNSRPTITATTDNHNQLLPLLHRANAGVSATQFDHIWRPSASATDALQKSRLPIETPDPEPVFIPSVIPLYTGEQVHVVYPSSAKKPARKQ